MSINKRANEMIMKRREDDRKMVKTIKRRVSYQIMVLSTCKPLSFTLTLLLDDDLSMEPLLNVL